MRKITKIQPSVPSLPTRKRVTAYARVSGDTDKETHSLSAQVSHYSAFIQKHAEWEYAGVYADLAQTGTLDTRREWNRMLADCEAGKIDIILVKSISRFARNTLDLLGTVRRLKELGVEVRFEKENINSMSGDGELMLTILASFAQEENRNTSDNIKWSIRRGFQNGKQSSTQLYGYRWDGENFVIEPDEAEVVRFIFAEYLAEKSPRAIAKALNAKGVKTMFGEKWWQQTIMSILENEKYIGTVIMQKTFVECPITHKKRKNNGELPSYVIENAHPAIISREIFDAVKARIQGRKIAVERTVFTSMIECEVCGVNFQRATKSYNSKKKKVWTCGNKKQGLPCDCTVNEIPESVLEKVTAEVLGLAEFDAAVFKAKVKRIVAPTAHTLIFHFQNGKTVTREWESTARTDCWTDERRAAQAERMRGQVVSEETREKRRVATTRHYEQHPERRKADSERMKKFCAENPEWGIEQNKRLTARHAEIKAGKGGAL
nr:Resolvase, N-terminal domain protein [uncultured bacterium]